MKKITKHQLLLILVIALGTFLRFFRLSSVPPSPSLDEVSIGYNAYSILKTGRDEYGTPFPILLRAYDDWRPALYMYLVIPTIKLLGLTTGAIRLPSALIGTFTVLLTYFLVLKLFHHKAPKKLALLSAMFLAVSPWHIYLSRLGHEVNLGLFLDVLGAIFFLTAIQNRRASHLVGASVVFVLALYSYQSQKVIVPVVLLGLFAIYVKQLRKDSQRVVFATVLGLVLVIPLARASLAPDALVRFRATTAFSADHPLIAENRDKFTRAKQTGDVVGQFISHRWVAMATIAWSNYLVHFDPRWLFFGTGRESHKVPNLGLLYWWELPLVLLGFLKLFSLRERQSKYFILLWLLASPLPAAITTQAPHAMRAMSALPYVQILSALGIVSLFELAGWKVRILLSIIGSVILGLSVSFFIRQYFSIFPKTQSDSFQYALVRSIKYTLLQKDSYDRIVFSNENNLYQSYMFFLFYSRYDPEKYLASGGTKSGGFAQKHAFDRYEFRPINWSRDKQTDKILFIGNPKDFSPDAKTQTTFQHRDGTVGVVAVSP